MLALLPGAPALLLHHPTASKESVVFSFAGDLWKTPIAGGEAVRLTATPGRERDPYFSPDGRTIAFTGQYDGNEDVYVMPVEGGNPRRLTAFPGWDQCSGWSADGKSVLFASDMISATDYSRLFTVPITGGFPKALPLPSGVRGSFSENGAKIAYGPNDKWQRGWKRYRGGQTTPIRILDLADSRWKDVPRSNTNDDQPVWIGSSIYYLSDPEGPVVLMKYDGATGKTRAVTKPLAFDLKAATAGPGGIALEKFGGVAIYDPATGSLRDVPITVRGELPELRVRWVSLAANMTGASLSPTGKRVLVTGRGFVGTVPVEKGDARVFEGAVGIDRREAAWSPDGRTIAYISDEGGTQGIVLRDAVTGSERRIALAESPGVYRDTTWSPDSTAITYADEKLNLWMLDVASGVSRKVDTGVYRYGNFSPKVSWSPDSKWMAYDRDLRNHFKGIFLWSRETGKSISLTGNLAFASSPAFDRDGRHLHFLAGTTVGLGTDGQDIAALAQINPTASVYTLVLRKDDPSPLAPESDEESPTVEGKKPEVPAKPDPFRIDLDGIAARTVALPVPTANYSGLVAGPAGSFFLLKREPNLTPTDSGEPGTILKWDAKKRKVVTFATGANDISVSSDGEKGLIDGTRLVDTTGDSAGPGKPVTMTGLRVKIEPREEWRRLFDSALRQEKMLFYDPKMHGVDMAALEKKYAPFLDGLASRADLNFLFEDMFGELSVGHMFIRGGDQGPNTAPRPPVAGGLLGADYRFENGRYRFDRVFDGEQWNPALRAPLAAPGVGAKAGEYLFAIDGHELTDATDVYEALEGKAGVQVKLKIGPNANGDGARTVTVVPVPSEAGLRQRAWTEDNRRYVEKETGGRAGYVHVPDTSVGGWTEFARYYYAQSDKAGLVVDDRFNHGGSITDFLVREMIKPLVFGSRTRYGADWRISPAAVYGPKVMLVNEMAGSGGDIFPWLFRSEGVGKLVGKRTWGAMISSYGFALSDGGSITAPDDAIYDPKTGEWVIENEGTAPDIEVELDPYLWRQGRDAQLEAAVKVLKEEMARAKPVLPKRPAYPNKTKLGGS